MYHRGSFREDINKKCLLCKDADIGIKHIINECNILKNERENLLRELNIINKRKDNEFLTTALIYNDYYIIIKIILLALFDL